MSETVISVENLTKEYRLGIINHGTLRQDMQSWWAKLCGHEDPNSLVTRQKNSLESISCNPHILALDNVSFTVTQGEVLGIIGRNGAGKSTLLKILSRVTAPTQGSVKIDGRVASLLEVGTGFHPELTGRENIYLNGAILGMKKKEIALKFDEIVAFSGIEQFIDTPVKRYSSGMYVRLAFAVAAHLEPEILIVDEVLAVGDVSFQKKCIGKMSDVARGGRTVLFVSHNMTAIENLCTRSIIIENGGIKYSGNTSDAINLYLGSFTEEKQDLTSRSDRKGGGFVRITKIDIENESGEKDIPFHAGSRLKFRIDYTGKGEIRNSRLIIGVYDAKKSGVVRFDTEVANGHRDILPVAGEVFCSTECLNLVGGRYFINIAFFVNNELEDYVTEAAFFDIVERDFFGTGKDFSPESNLMKILVKHHWGLS